MGQATEKIWTIYYEAKDLFLIFIAGHAISRGASTPRIANHIARAIGVKRYQHTTIRPNGIPVTTVETVY